MILRTYGSLKDSFDGDSLDIQSPISVRDFVQKINISKSAVKMVMINHRPAGPESLILPTDSVALFPREYPFFADWKDFWW